MEIELLEKKDQPLLLRIDITFKITHPNERTPKRAEVREELANQMNLKKSSIIIDNMKAVFGKPETLGYAKVYKSDKDAKEMERKHILIRNKLLAAKADKGEAKKKEEKKEKPSDEPKE